MLERNEEMVETEGVTSVEYTTLLTAYRIINRYDPV
jgi:hypothetical protein